MLGITDYLFRLIPGNPILLRVVQAAGKRRRDLFIRCGYLGLLAGFVCLRIISEGGGFGTDLTKLSQISGQMFQTLSYIQLGLVALLAPIFTAGAITQEQDSQTYDILLSTPLTNGQIVLGSMLSRVFFIFALLVSGIPIFSITQVFGGVAIGSIITSFGIACATAMITGSLAMAIAAFKVGTRRTIFAFYLFIVVFLVGGFLLDRVDSFHPTLAYHADTPVERSDAPAEQNPPPIVEKFPDRITTTTTTYHAISTGERARYLITRVSITRAKTSWFTSINPFLALRVIFNDETYVAPQRGTLPDWMQSWPLGWYLSAPASFYISFMFILSFVLVMPSIMLLRRVAQSSTNLRTRILTLLRLSRGDRTRKPRYVWNNPIAWREARTKASAARATFIRLAFMGGGLLGAIMLVVYSSRTEPISNYITPASYSPDAQTLTIFDSHSNHATTYNAGNTKVHMADHPNDEIALDSLHGQYEVYATTFAPSGLKLPNGDPDTYLQSIVLAELKPVLPVDRARQYFMGLVIIEFAGILLIVTNAAASTVTREKEDGTLDLLLSTPITSRYYIWGKLRGLVSFVLPLVAIPVISAVILIIADFVKRLAGSTQPPLIVPEAALVMPGTLIMVSAFAAILGMQMSLRSRTTVWAVMTSVGIIAGVCAGLGACGYMAMEGASSGSTGSPPALGISCFSPFSLIAVLIDPWARGGSAFRDDPFSSRILIFVCGWIATGAYAMIVWGMYTSMVKNFDMTIRRQSR